MSKSSGSIVDELTLLTVIETGSFSAAARRMKVTQSSISRRIARLEARLGGTKLISRTTRSMSPTEAGTDYAAGIKRVVELFNEADESVSTEHNLMAGDLRVSVPPGLGRARVGPVLSQLAKDNEGLRYELFLDNTYLDLYSNNFDLAIELRDIHLKDTRSVTLGVNWWVFVAAPDYLETHRGDRIVDHQFVVPTFRHSAPIERSAEILQHKIAQQNTRVRVADTTLALQFSRDGHGVALLPWLLVECSVHAGELALLELDEPWPSAPIVAIYRTSLHNTRKLQVTLDALRQTVEEAGEPVVP